MYPNSQLTREDWVAFLKTLRLVRMTDNDPLVRCIKAAYRSLNRTIYGARAVPQARQDAQALLYHRLASLRDRQTQFVDQDQFDTWHQATCQSLVDSYTEHSYKYFTFGQAQKWLNVALKQSFALCDERLIVLGQCYRFCHIPIDTIIMLRLAAYGAPTLSQRWSRLTNYCEYLDYQMWVRQHFKLVPLDIELLVYRGDDVWNQRLPLDGV